MTEQSHLIQRLERLNPAIDPVAKRFTAAGFRLYLVGGIVRDLLLPRGGSPLPEFDVGFDIDFTTNARPSDIKRLLAPLADAVWTQGERFGTIGASVNGEDLEITTHRAERYDPDSRKPVVSFGDELGEDLSRRDFTVNAMAIEVPGAELHDPYHGAADLEAHLLRTPLSPEISFTDDPLRMMRAARFVARFELQPDPALMVAATTLADRITIVSVERVADEIERLLRVEDPGRGFEFLRTAGLLTLAVVKMSDEQERQACVMASAGDGSTEVGALVRRAGLLWSSDVKAVMTRLRYSNESRQHTAALVSAVRSWVYTGQSTLSDGRRLLHDVGSPEPAAGLALNLVAHHRDETVREAARRLFDVIAELKAASDTGPFLSPLTGAQIMDTLQISPGPLVGAAQKLLRRHRLEHGPFGEDEAADILHRWHSD